MKLRVLNPFARRKQKKAAAVYPETTYESFSKMFFPTGKLAEGYKPEIARKLEQIRADLLEEKIAKERDKEIRDTISNSDYH